MSHGNKFNVTVNPQQRQHNQLSLEEMGNVLLDAMQGTLICLDHQHIIVDVSKTVKHYFGFEQTDIVGLSILLLIEDSERDTFLKFLNSPSQPHEICSVRMMIAITNNYRQVKVHRKKKANHDTVDVHSTTTKPNGSVRTILVLTVDDSSYIDITLFDIHKQEFYTKMNLTGEIIFEDHRGALITGYLPHELLSHSIFNFVYHEDRLVKLHALWKCVTTSTSKLQWRFNTRHGSVVFLQTEYKLIANHTNHEIIVARNEVMSPAQQSHFDELQTAWRHQCAADIRGNSSSFKLLSSTEADSSVNNGCRISVPSLNMCFSTNKLQSENILGNIFDGSKLSRPLTIQDYIQILIDNDKYLDNELIHMLNSIRSLASRQNVVATTTNISDQSLSKRPDSDSIVRGILSNSIKYNHDKATGDSSQMLNGDANSMGNDQPRMLIAVQQTPSRLNSISLNAESIHQQHLDFMKKYKSAKVKLESQLEIARAQEAVSGGHANDVMKRNNVLNKLYQLEHIKNKHIARKLELKRQTMGNTDHNSDGKDLLNSSSPNPPSVSSLDPNATSPLSTLFNPSISSLYSNNYQHSQRNSPSMPLDSGQVMSFQDSHTRVKAPRLDDHLSQSSLSPYTPVNNPSLSVHSYMNVSFRDTTSNSSSIPPQSSSSFNHHYSQHSSPYPY